MKITVDSLALSEAVNKVIKALSIKKNNPILECIKLSARDSMLILSATDLELSIEKKIMADVTIEGEVLVPGKFFAEFIKKITYEQIILECADGCTLEIKYGESYGFIHCLNVNDFPSIGEVNDKYLISLKNKDMKDLISKTIFCTSMEDSRPVLKGCLIELNNTEIKMIALDGYRLGLCRKKVISSNIDVMQCIIPSRSLLEISKMLGDDEEDVLLKIDDDKLYVDIDNTVIISRLIKGDYINYRNIINVDFSAIVTVSKSQFSEYIDRASLISRISKNNLIKLEIKEGCINVESNSEMGNLKESLPARTEGKENVICFNSKYLQDMLAVINDDFIKINIKASSSPCIFTPVDSDEYLFLVLPMRVVS